jgi:catechol 2,3-dioxygenase
LGPVKLSVGDLERSLGFYRDLVGLRVLAHAGSEVSLGTGDLAIVRLVEEPGARPAPRRSTGLFHTAILFPDRASLASVARHIASRQYPFSGASDHLVSEALYLDDPDGHGAELYRDRPRAEWRWENGELQMATLPLDVTGLLAEATGEFAGAPEGTCVGHVHLKANDVGGAGRFFTNVVGLALTARYGESASFFASDGYHHHFAANVWQSRGAAPAPDGHVRLVEYVIQTEHLDAVAAFAARAEAAGLRVVHDGARASVTDPWEQKLVVTAL